MRDFIIHEYTPGNEWVTIQVNDLLHNAHYMDVKMIDLAAYEDGAHIQDAFPYLTAGQRELIITGINDEMWGDMFGDEEE
jgi:hypothetical protein